jgi:hypothetical protein
MYGAAGFLQKMNDSFFKSVAENFMVHFLFYYITIEKLPNNRVIYSLPYKRYKKIAQEFSNWKYYYSLLQKVA